MGPLKQLPKRDKGDTRGCLPMRRVEAKEDSGGPWREKSSEEMSGTKDYPGPRRIGEVCVTHLGDMTP